MINLFDNPINTEDQEAVLAVKRLDQQNLQKFVNIVEAIRALRYIAKTNWYYAFGVESQDSQNPLICGYQQLLENLQEFTKLEFAEITGQAVANTIDKISEYRKLIENTIEKQVISTNNTFTSDIAFARQVLPVLMMLMDAFSALYLEAQRNVLATYELEARQDDANEPFVEDAEYHLLMDKALRFSRLFLDNPSTSKALLGANLSEILEQAARFMHSRGQSLTTELSHSKNTTITA